MSGKESFSCKVGEYVIHNCAEACLNELVEDPNKVFGAIDLPD